jgi:transcriptional regulator with XRE-family HTH domain
MTKKTEKPSAWANATPSYGWKERGDYKKENRQELRKSMNVALRILDLLDERKMSQQDLADKLKVTRQQVSKILKGQENMTLETVEKLERGLGIELVKVLDGEDEVDDLNSIVIQEDVYIAKFGEIINNKRINQKVISSIAEHFTEKRAYPGSPKEFVAGENTYAMAC